MCCALQAKLQAWLVNLLTVVVEAYDLLGKDAADDDALAPDVLYHARQSVKADAIYDPPA